MRVLLRRERAKGEVLGSRARMSSCLDKFENGFSSRQWAVCRACVPQRTVVRDVTTQVAAYRSTCRLLVDVAEIERDDKYVAQDGTRVYPIAPAFPE